MATVYKKLTATPTIDTAVYANLDRLGSVMTFAAAGQANGGSGWITQAMLEDNATASLLLDIRLHIFAVTPTLVGADNAAFDLSDANATTADKQGTIDFWAASSTLRGATGRWVPGMNTGSGPLGGSPIFYTCASGDTALYGVLEARSAYDAAATNDLTVKLWVESLS